MLICNNWVPRPVTMMVLVVSLSVPAMADSFSKSTNSLLTVEGQELMAQTLAQKILLVTVTPKPEKNQDPAFLPKLFGQAIFITRGNEAELLTSSYLADLESDVTLSTVDGKKEYQTKTSRVDKATGIAVLEPVTKGPFPTDAQHPATAESTDIGSSLYFVIPAGFGKPVLGHTKVFNTGVFPFEHLVEVGGNLPPGTPLFSPNGQPAAIAITKADKKGSRTLAASLTPPKPLKAAAPDTSEAE